MKRILAFALVLALSLMPLTALAELKTLDNPHLIKWNEIFTMLTLNSFSENPGGEYVLSSGTINYDPDTMRSNSEGIHMADGGFTSSEGSYSLGQGASPEAEDMWYVSFTYTQDTDWQIIVDNTINMVFACAYMADVPEDGTPIADGFGETDEERSDTIQSILMVLLASEEAIAVEVGDFVFISKPLGNQLLITFDTLAFYNAFYKGSIENYFIL